MVELIERCFGEHMIQWGPKLQEMIPSYGETLAKNVKLYDEMWEYTQKTLKLEQ